MFHESEITRRDFMRRGAMTVGALSLAAVAEQAALGEEVRGREGIRCAVVGTGVQGRRIMARLSRMRNVSVVALCDIWRPQLDAALKTAGRNTEVYADYARMLRDEAALEAVIVATSSAAHAEICTAALQADKHVWCEAPMVLSVEDGAKLLKIANASKQMFQVAHVRRFSPLYNHALSFMKGGAIGKVMTVRAQWHRKESWRKPAANEAEDKILNWRLYKKTSGGLAMEFGCDQIDTVNWFLGTGPASVTGVGGLDFWQDGREVCDNIHLIYEYPGGVTLSYSATLMNSFQGENILFMGTTGAMLLTPAKGLLFKEADAAALGAWETFAKKEALGDEQGIFLDANATKFQKNKEGQKIEEEKGKDDLFLALEGFFASIDEGKRPRCGAEEGRLSATAGIVANEAIDTKKKIDFATNATKNDDPSGAKGGRS